MSSSSLNTVGRTSIRFDAAISEKGADTLSLPRDLARDNVANRPESGETNERDLNKKEDQGERKREREVAWERRKHIPARVDRFN